MNLNGEWRVISSEQGNGIIRFEQDGDAWSIILGREDHAPSMHGVGFEYDGFLYTARGIVGSSAELDGTVGLVQYNLQTLGNLPARWYHSSLGGKLSDGMSTNGPNDSVVGEYQADYQNADGNSFNPLRKTITGTSSCYQFSWWDEEKVHYVGVGRKINNALFAA